MKIMIVAIIIPITYILLGGLMKAAGKATPLKPTPLKESDEDKKIS